MGFSQASPDYSHKLEQIRVSIIDIKVVLERIAEALEKDKK